MLEIVRPASASRARVAIFDFDGTLSLIRTGWINIMVPMMVRILQDLNTGESEEDLRKVVDEFVWRLTGKETIYQMMALCDEITTRGGTPLEPRVYKQQYLDLLWEEIKTRVEALRSGKASPEDHLVPGSRALLESLKARGIKMSLASGTDHAFVQDEANLLDVSKYFDGGVFGALDDLKAFSKAILIQRILSTAEFTGDELIGFGDGYVEIEEVKKAGGVTVGVATTEPECVVVDDWKRQRLIGVGADYIVPNYIEHQKLLDTLFANGQA